MQYLGHIVGKMLKMVTHEIARDLDGIGYILSSFHRTVNQPYISWY